MRYTILLYSKIYVGKNNRQKLRTLRKLRYG